MSRLTPADRQVHPGRPASTYSADDFTADLAEELRPSGIIVGTMVVIQDRVTLELQPVHGRQTVKRFQLETEVLSPELAEQLATRICASLTAEQCG